MDYQYRQRLRQQREAEGDAAISQQTAGMSAGIPGAEQMRPGALGAQGAPTGAEHQQMTGMPGGITGVGGMPPAEGQPPDSAGGLPAVKTVERAIGPEQLSKAIRTLNKYKAGKARTEQRIIASEQWWKRRHWEYMDEYGNPKDHRPASAWLFNCIMSKHADAIEAYPEPNILPREVGDKDEAKKLSAIIPVVLEQNEYEETYGELCWQKLKQGTAIEGIFWDPSRHNGLGDVTVRRIDALNIYPEPGVRDIQQSRNVFTTELVDRDALREQYPDKLSDKTVTGRALEPSKYIYDDNIDTSDKAVVVDWYYKRRINNRSVLHYVKFVDDVILYSSEDDPRYSERGYYDHGLYPFVFDQLFPIEGSLFGYGYIDIGKDAQETIDRLNQAIEKNALMGAQPRWFSRNEGSVNEEEFADWTRPLVHVTSGSLGDDSLRQISVDPLPTIYANILTLKIDELKETTGNRDTANGGTQAGVTAASAIAALQEQAGKTSRASTRGAYRAYSRMVNMVIELIRQFYDLPRQYRIIGQSGEEEFTQYDNSGLKPQPQQAVMGMDMGLRLPVFDVSVSTQKMTAYTKIAQNEMALQLWSIGVLDPQNADKALALLDIMDFDHKDLIEDKVRRNGTMYQMLTMYQQIALQLAKQTGQADVVEALAQNVLGVQQQMGATGSGDPSGLELRNDNVSGMQADEHAFVQKARTNAQQSTKPE